MAAQTTIGDYLIHRLEELGVKHIFGVPGDYVLGFYDLLVESKMDVIGTCTEAGAGFAADGYARTNGLGALCITYCVGGFNVLNSVAGAYAEKSPVIVISGAPGLDERTRSPLLHHAVKDFNTQLRVFERVTAAAVALEDADSAPNDIDDALEICLNSKRPVYIELPRDMVNVKCAAPKPFERTKVKSNKAALNEAIEEAAEMLRKAKKPVVLGGVELHRFGLQKQMLDLVEKAGYPVAATLLGKSVIRENHPQYLGIYEGAMGSEDVRKAVESADCVLTLGAFMTDINLGIYTARLDIAKTISATSERIAIKHHSFDDVTLKDFITGLNKANLGRKRAVKKKKEDESPFEVKPKKKLTVKRLFERIDDMLTEKTVVICDIGDSLFGAADLQIKRRTEFLSPAYYTSMGFAVPAALGAHINKPNLRPLVFVGDGAFQMTGFELSTIARYGLNPIVIVLNNKGYSTERFIDDGPYNDVLNWAYHEMPAVLQHGWGVEVHTEGELEDALEHAWKDTDSYSIINVHLDPYDRSKAMERLGKRLGQHVGKDK